MATDNMIKWLLNELNYLICFKIHIVHIRFLQNLILIVAICKAVIYRVKCHLTDFFLSRCTLKAVFADDILTDILLCCQQCL